MGPPLNRAFTCTEILPRAGGRIKGRPSTCALLPRFRKQPKTLYRQDNKNKTTVVYRKLPAAKQALSRHSRQKNSCMKEEKKVRVKILPDDGTLSNKEKEYP